MFGLPQRKAAFARGDNDTIRMTQDGIVAKAARLVPTRWILACLDALLASTPRSCSCAATSTGKFLHQRPLAPAHRKFFRAAVEQHHPALLALLHVRFLEAADVRLRHHAVAVDAHERPGEFLLQVGE